MAKAIESLGGTVKKDDTLYQRYRALSKLVSK